MAQGSKLKKKTIVKSRPSAAHKKSSATTANSAQMRKGRVVKAAKNKGIVKHNKLQRKLVANVTNSLEQVMAVKAGAVGKLTIMKEAQNKGKTIEVKRRKY